MKKVVAVGSLLLVAACGASKNASDATSAPQQLAAEAAAASPAPALQYGDNDSMVAWQTQFDEALADVERLDCPNACRALQSLERSAAHICGTVGQAHAVCRDVEERKTAARAKVTGRCGVCP